jgi:Protein of unknown function (DUF2849)
MQMIVASRLTDGRVVFLADEARWAESIEDGLVAESAEAASALLELAQNSVRNCRVVDPYAIDVAVGDGRRRPTAMREAIRAFGPTITVTPERSGS